jgi:hypothetical protein
MKNSATAVHARNDDGSEHVVGIGNLRVLLLKDEGSWFAQGLDIDYFAQGSSLADAQRRFQSGLLETIDVHLRTYGNVDGVLQPAPAEVWAELLHALPLRRLYSQISFHKGEKGESNLAVLPFSGVEFYEAAAA